MDNVGNLGEREWLSPQQLAQHLGISVKSAIRLAERIDGVVDLAVISTVSERDRIRRHRTLRVPRAGLMRLLHNRRIA